ncbi:MAG: FAD-binding oxidoreductase, partial [Candidatus Spechtbacterales bacterium]
MELIEKLKEVIQGEVATDEETLAEYSADASIFQVRPKAVVFPKDTDDVKALVTFVSEHKAQDSSLSLTARSAGTDMSGGPLNESIIVGFTKHMNQLLGFEGDRVRVQPGMYYRDFEIEAEKRDLLLPSYPASKELAAMGGLINNNSGGELTLRWGKTNRYIEELKVVLADGNEYTLSKLSMNELNAKRRQQDFEGELYRQVHDVLEKNYDAIQAARPNVTKNSAGYALWDVYNR